MAAILTGLAGFWFTAALGAAFLSATVEQASAPRAPHEEPSRPGLGSFLIGLASFLTPILLLLHAYLITAGQPDTVRFSMMALPVVAVLAGSFVGALSGLALRPARIVIRMAAIVFALGALIVTLIATAPSLETTLTALQNTGVFNAAAAQR